MKKFERGATCPKCDSQQPPKIQWFEAGPGKATAGGPVEPRPERLRIECRECGFFWMRAPLDATETRLDPAFAAVTTTEKEKPCSDSDQQNSASSR